MSIQLQEIQSIYISQNRLVEGKDYVRAEWLKKSGLARIDIPTNYNMVDSVTCYFKHYGGTTGQMPIFGGDKIHALLWKYNSAENKIDTYFNNQYYFNINATEGKFKVKFNWQDKKRLISWNNVNKGGWSSCALDKTNTKISVFDSSLFNQSCHIHTGALAMKYFFLAPNIYLYPCKLLQDIPASLDANNRARTAGECGMVDSISGKFYGNVASSGAFTVENLDESGTVEDTRLHQIYMNKLVEGKDYIVGEWLMSTGGSWLDTKLIDFGTAEYMELEVKKTPTKGAAVFGCEAPSNTNRLILTLDYYENKDRFVMYISTNVNSINNYSQGVVNINFNTKKVTLAGGTYTASFIPTTLQNTFPLFAKKANNGTATIANEAANLCISYFKVDGLINLVPCHLLRSIPRNLDAQCKPRVTGECGMIDLISGRFYGNVADSGAFSLEWDEWLKDCSIQIAIPSECYAFIYTTRIDTTKLTSELVDFGFIKLSNTQIVYGDEDDGYVYTVDWGTNKWATLDIGVMSGNRAVTISLNGTTGTTFYNAPLILNPHIYLFDIMQIKQIVWTIMVESTVTNTTLTRYVDENTGQQGLISDQDGTIIYAD